MRNWRGVVVLRWGMPRPYETRLAACLGRPSAFSARVRPRDKQLAGGITGFDTMATACRPDPSPCVTRLSDLKSRACCSLPIWARRGIAAGAIRTKRSIQGWLDTW